MSPYGGPVSRLKATVDDNAGPHDCWPGTGRDVCRKGYHRMNFWVPGLGRAVKLSTHVLLWVAAETGFKCMNDLYLAYLEMRHSGLDLDHGCENRACRNPLHLEAMTHQNNVQLAYDRRAARAEARGYVDVEPEPEEIEF